MNKLKSLRQKQQRGLPSYSPSLCCLKELPRPGSRPQRSSLRQLHRQPQLDCSSSSTTTTNTAPKPRRVKFGNLTVSEHMITLGDHPWVDGPPIALSWEQVDSITMDVDDFERKRAGMRRKERNLRRSGSERESLLKEFAGFSATELLHARRIRTHIASRTKKMRTTHPR